MVGKAGDVRFAITPDVIHTCVPVYSHWNELINQHVKGHQVGGAYSGSLHKRA